MLKRAAEANATAEQMAQDLAAVDAADQAEAIVALYGAQGNDLRAELARAAVLSHGNVMSGIEWRIDSVASTDRAKEINLAVAMLTFHYVDNATDKRITLQVLPDMLGELRRVCDQILS